MRPKALKVLCLSALASVLIPFVILDSAAAQGTSAPTDQIQRTPKAQRHLERGKQEMRKGLLVAATVSLTDAIAIHPDDAKAHELRAMCFEGMQRTDAAISDYAKAVDLGSTALQPYQKLFAHYRTHQQHQKGIATARALISNISFNEVAGYWEMADFYERRGDQPAALTALRTALDLTPEDPNAPQREQRFREQLVQKVRDLERAVEGRERR